ncbi:MULTISPECIES: TIGR01906 family membrane protein [unclassified Clostridium]|uniref:TIGR01906 family membrane protein n=1 Tax=unclassified Clostridium TaxID=2614128 RepID=UPI001FAC30B1|nr:MULTISPECIES: TIGR01906 family membrane protein [unclassified Clostridium]MEE0931974.1 TIGR01906 family membrane protein [Clostridium sp.]
MRKVNGEKVYLNSVLKILMSIFTAISIIAISTIIALNLRFIYKFIIDKYDLVNITGVSVENLMIDYSGLINYLQNPFIGSLKFQNFPMSPYGEIHFYEVKRIFIALIIISLIFIIGNLIYVIVCRIKGYKYFSRRVIGNLNSGSNILIMFFIILVAVYIIDFSKAFIIFHKIFFKNDYWVFDENMDPIINALPEDLFMIYGAIILGIIIISSIIIKVINKKCINDKVSRY